MRFATKVDRNIVKAFIQKDKTITCPINADYYALIDDRILSALCVVNQENCYHIQGMRTAREDRKKGYATELLKYVISRPQYSDKPICADCLIYSKNIFAHLGFKLVDEFSKGKHTEWKMIKEN